MISYMISIVNISFQQFRIPIYGYFNFSLRSFFGLFNESVQYNHIRIMDCHIKETDIVLAKDTNFPQFRPTNFLLSEELQKLIHIFQVFEIF